MESSPSSPRSRAAEGVRNVFWVAVIACIGLYAFLAALGAFDPLDAIGLTVAVAVLVVLWLIHAWTLRAHRAEVRDDPRLKSARERRGF